MPDTVQLELEIPAHLGGRRLDQALAELVQEYSRSRLQQWIRAGQVTVDARTARVRETVHGGEQVRIEAEIADQINALGANLVMIMPAFSRGGFGPGMGRMPTLSYDDVGAIVENVTGINGVSAEQSTTQDIKGSTILEGISVVGTTAGFPQVRDYQVAEGRFITDEDNDRANKIVVLGYDITQELFGGQSAVGQSIKIGSTKFTVVPTTGCPSAAAVVSVKPSPHAARSPTLS